MADAPSLEVITLPCSQDLRYSATLDAPPDLVFLAYTSPELYARWSSRGAGTVEIEELDARTGGSYRWRHREPTGETFVCRGVYHEVVPAQRIVSTCQLETEEGEGLFLVERIYLEPLPEGRTLLTGQVIFISEEVRDTELEEMIEGMHESNDRLVALLADLRTQRPAA